MSCSCHINPPCSYCISSYECFECGEIRNSDEHGIVIKRGEHLCTQCFEDIGNNIFTQLTKGSQCECGKEKFEFSSHSYWCPKST